MRKFLIVARSFNENSGGNIALHKLCDQINRVGASAFLLPFVDNYEISSNNFVKPILKVIRENVEKLLPFRVDDALLTPVLHKLPMDINCGNWIVVYPEVVFGNPLRAKHVVRWFLHHPGHITGAIYYGDNELYFRYHSGIRRYQSQFSRLSETELTMVHYPLNLYNEEGVSPVRKGTAYCIRKGIGKKIVHDLTDSILIDGKSHKDIAAIFKRVKRFISYDVYTAYSRFAVLCGCESVVIPDNGVNEDEWLPDPRDRYGVSYGFENLEKSKLTINLLAEQMVSEQSKNLHNVSSFIEEASGYFKD